MRIIKTQKELDELIAKQKERGEALTIGARVPFSFCLTIWRKDNGDYYLFSYSDESHDTFEHDKEFPKSLYGKCLKKGALYCYEYD